LFYAAVILRFIGGAEPNDRIELLNSARRLKYDSADILSWISLRDQLGDSSNLEDRAHRAHPHSFSGNVANCRTPIAQRTSPPARILVGKVLAIGESGSQISGSTCARVGQQ
jgi:hypothetical protein